MCGLEVVNCSDLTLSIGKSDAAAPSSGSIPSVSVDKSSRVTVGFASVEALPDQVVWCDSESIRITSSTPATMKFCALNSDGSSAAASGAGLLPEAAASLELVRPAGVDPRKQLQTKFVVLERAGAPAEAEAGVVVVGVITRPFDLFDGVIAMAPPGYYA